MKCFKVVEVLSSVAQTAEDVAESYFDAILAIAMIFHQAAANNGLTSFAAMGHLVKEDQDEIADKLVREWASHSAFIPTLREWSLQVDAKNILRAFGCAEPNGRACTFLTFSLLIVQKELTPDSPTHFTPQHRRSHWRMTRETPAFAKYRPYFPEQLDCDSWGGTNLVEKASTMRWTGEKMLGCACAEGAATTWFCWKG
jgi:hypothetical protein